MSKQMLNAYEQLKDIFVEEIQYGSAYLCNIVDRDVQASRTIKNKILAEIKEKIKSASTWYVYMIKNDLIDELDYWNGLKIANEDRIKWLNKQIKHYGGK